jgi:hypothetical protein
MLVASTRETLNDAWLSWIFLFGSLQHTIFLSWEYMDTILAGSRFHSLDLSIHLAQLGALTII